MICGMPHKELRVRFRGGQGVGSRWVGEKFMGCFGRDAQPLWGEEASLSIAFNADSDVGGDAVGGQQPSGGVPLGASPAGGDVVCAGDRASAVRGDSRIDVRRLALSRRVAPHLRGPGTARVCRIERTRGHAPARGPDRSRPLPPRHRPAQRRQPCPNRQRATGPRGVAEHRACGSSIPCRGFSRRHP